MLTIRQPQVDVFWSARDRELIPKIVAYLREVEPERSAAHEGELEPWVQSQLVPARDLGVRRAWDRSRFVRYALRYGSGFATQEPWASRVFARPDLDGTERMDRVEFIHRNYLVRDS